LVCMFYVIITFHLSKAHYDTFSRKPLELMRALLDGDIDSTEKEFTFLKQTFLEKHKRESRNASSDNDPSEQISIDTSNCDLLDLLTRTGQLIELRGKSGSAKSQLALWTMVQVLNQGQSVMFVDADNGLCHDRLKRFIAKSSKNDQDSLMDRLYVSSADNGEQLVRILHMMTQQQQFADIRLLVIDSLNSITIAQMLELRGASEPDLVFDSVQSILNAIDDLLQNRSSPLTLLVTNSSRSLLGPLWKNRVDQRVRLARCETSDEHFDLTYESSLSCRSQFVLKVSNDCIEIFRQSVTHDTPTPSI
jgi:archaellum biogenesis ATPase FlaH